MTERPSGLERKSANPKKDHKGFQVPSPTDCGRVEIPGVPLMTETEIRTLLLTRLAARLGVDPSSLDPRESFSSYGLDSAGAIGLISEMSDALGMELSPTLIWAHPTPAEMARHLAVGDTAPAVSTSSRPTAPVDEPVAV